MAIAKMNRFTLLTFHPHKDALLGRLQVFGDVHLGNPDAEELSFLQSDFSQEQLTRREVELEKVRFAAGNLAKYAGKAGKRPTLTFEEFDGYIAGYDYESVYQKVLEQDEAIAEISSEMQRRLAENELLAPWMALDTAPADLEALQATGHLLGTINKQVLEELTAALEEQFPCVYVERLDTVKEDAALLLLFPAVQEDDVFALVRDRGFTRLGALPRGIPSACVEENLAAVERLEEKRRIARAAIEALAPEYPKLLIAQDYFETVLERERARRNFLTSDTTLLIEGWVPEDDSAKLRDVLQAVCGDEFYLELQAVEKDNEDVPIKLKNNAFVRAFESITSMYSMPKYNEIDPTPILAPFYWLFFGMMVGDIGYGAVIFLGTTLALKLLDLGEGMRGFMRFFRFLSISVILMGLVYGGAFGVTVFAPVPVYEGGVLTGHKAILDSQLDITVMLIISIVIGVVHLCVGLITKAYMGFRDGNYADGIFDGLFWMIALLSGIGWLLGGTGIVAGIGTPSKWVFILSLIGLAATQGRSSPSIGGKIGNGLYGVYGITSYVGDVVSYTRIVALALSGAYIAYAFNLMTGLIVGDFSGNVLLSIIRLIFGIIVVIFGQTLNLGLAMLGGYVHSCRLQYVEFFGKFYDGGGVMFRPLTLKTDHIHIKQ